MIILRSFLKYIKRYSRNEIKWNVLLDFLVCKISYWILFLEKHLSKTLYNESNIISHIHKVLILVLFCLYETFKIFLNNIIFAIDRDYSGLTIGWIWFIFVASYLWGVMLEQHCWKLFGIKKYMSYVLTFNVDATKQKLNLLIFHL